MDWYVHVLCFTVHTTVSLESEIPRNKDLLKSIGHVSFSSVRLRIVMSFGKELSTITNLINISIYSGPKEGHLNYQSKPLSHMGQSYTCSKEQTYTISIKLQAVQPRTEHIKRENT